MNINILTCLEVDKRQDSDAARFFTTYMHNNKCHCYYHGGHDQVNAYTYFQRYAYLYEVKQTRHACRQMPVQVLSVLDEVCELQR